MAADPSDDPETLLAHAAWLRGLARGLARDPALADDAVQDTWVAALRRPPAADRPLRPWLRAVLTNAVRLRWRGDANRAAREQAAAAPGDASALSADELLERHETQRVLARLVTELEEPYRAAILLRYAEGLAPSDIARRLGVAAGTVRWRLHEGLARLRARLDALHRGDRRAWLTALAPLTKGLAMTTARSSPWILLALALLAALIAAWSTLRAIAPHHAPEAAHPGAAGAARAPATTPHDEVVTELAHGRPPGWIAQEAAPMRRVAGRVVVDSAGRLRPRAAGEVPARDRVGALVDATTGLAPPPSGDPGAVPGADRVGSSGDADGSPGSRSAGPAATSDRLAPLAGGTPAAGVIVRLTSELSLAGLASVLEQRTTADGAFDFGLQVARPVTVSAAVPGKLAAIAHVDLRDPTARPAPDALELVAGACLAAFYGKVSDAAGAPIAHAQLLREDAIGTTTDAAGSYELCAPPTAVATAQLQVVVRADGYGAVMIAAGLAGRVHHDFVLAPEATVTGRAVTRDGAPVAHAKIWIERADTDQRRETETTARLLAATDDAGQFRIAGLAPGRHRIGGAAAGLTAVPVTLAVVAGGSQDIALVMTATGVVHGRVLRGGEPVAGARVAVSGGAAEEAVSQIDGAFVLDRVPAGEVKLTASPYRVVSPTSATIAAGVRSEVVIEVEPLGLVRGTVRRHGVAVAGARVCAARRRPPNTCATAGALGRYELAGLEPGDYAVFADDAQVGASAREVALTLALGERRELDVELVAGARISGTVSDRGAGPAAGVHLRFARRGANDEARCVSDASGRFDCAAIAGGGAYDAAVFAGPDASVAFPFAGAAPPPIDVPDGDAQIDGVRLAIDAGRRAISGAIVDATGAPVSDARVHAWGDGPEPGWLVPTPASVSDADGAFRIGELAPGGYTVEVRTADGARQLRRGVAAGTQDLRLVVDTALCRGAAPAGSAAPLRTAIAPVEPTDIPHRPRGRVVWDDRIELIGWNLPDTVGLGQDLEVTLYYRVLRPVDSAWQIFLHLAGPSWWSADHEPSDGQCPTSIWKPGEVVVDRFTTRLPADRRTGTYEVRIGFFTGWAPSWTNLPLSEAPAELRHASDGLALTTIVVE